MGQWRTQRGNLKIPWDKWKWKHSTPISMGSSKSSFKREVYINTGLLHKTRKISNNLTYHVKELEKEQTKSKVSRRKEIKIRKEINRDQKERLMKTRAIFLKYKQNG